MLSFIKYSEPIVTEEENRPTSYANLPYEYNQLANPRRFEELLYSLIKVKIKHGSFQPFQTVNLMSGVGDKGQDCALFENGKATGVIQCKQYTKNYSKEEFGKEITKFVLYSLLDNRLIGNPNNFTYYIAVSSGFVKNCSDFIDDFNNQILQENNLNKWIDDNLKHPTLKALMVQSNLSQKVLEILSKIAVKKIFPQDLDAFLSEPACEHLAKIFFEIRTVTDSIEIKKLREELQFARLMTVNKIEQELNRGSISLRSEANEFDEIPNSHIQRDETQKLYNWTIADSPKNECGKCLNFCLLAGNAGMGKTVILKDLYDKLTEQGIAVLGLKADKLYAANIKELQNKIGLSLPIYDFIEACKEHNKTTVLIIDQIDALSQSMSSNRTFLQVYKDLIENYLYDENIKIIVSVRIFDLHYDPSLRVYKDIQTVIVNQLTNDQVQKELLKIGINREKVSNRLFELLRVPNTLNVFSRIYINDNGNVAINSIQGMYQELWKQKVYNIPPSSPNTSAEIKQVLYSIAQKMFSKQRISVPELQFEDQKAQISYLESERLLKKEGKLLQFFHQSFYDFVFAKQFAESEQDLITYIKNQDQSLTIRSAVKMIVEYLRDFDLDFYQQTLNDLFDDESILFHIKHLVFSSILYQTEPSADEENIVLKLVQNSVVFNNIFFEQAKAEAWLNLALNWQLLDYLKTEASLTFSDLPLAADLLEEQRNYQLSVGFDFLSYYVLNEYPSAWDFLLTMSNQKIYRNMLCRLVNWKNPRAFELFEKCEGFEILDNFGYYLTLKNIAKVNPEFSLDRITTALPEQFEKLRAQYNDFEERDVYKVIVNNIPGKFLSQLFPAFKKCLRKYDDKEYKLSGDYRFRNIDLHDKEHLNGSEYLYRLLGVCMRKSANANSPEFNNILGEEISSPHKSILRLIFFAIEPNVADYYRTVYDLFNHLLTSNKLDKDSEFSAEFRNLLQKAFPYFTEEQQLNTLNKIQNFVVKDEVFIWKRDDKPKFYSHWGLAKYLLLKLLPVEMILSIDSLKRQFQELDRKHNGYKELKGPRSLIAGAIRNPIDSESCARMNVKQWLRSFRKYKDDRDRFGDDYLKGGLHEHASAFKEFVKNDPNEEKLSIIETVLHDKTINQSYATQGVLGWIEGNGSATKILPLFKEILKQHVPGESHYEWERIANYLIRDKEVDKDILDYVVSRALNFKTEDETIYLSDLEEGKETSIISGLVTHAINTSYGSAAEGLLYVIDPNTSDLVFETLESILKNGPRESRAVIYFRFAYLMNLDGDRAFNLFMKYITSEPDIYVVASSIWSLQYLGNYDFKRLLPIYQKLANCNVLGSDDTNWVFLLLYSAYLLEQDPSGMLVKTLLRNSKNACSIAVNEITKHYYEIEKTIEKSNELLHLVLDLADEEIIEGIHWNFSSAENLKIDDLYDFIERYIRTKFFRNNENLLNYLTQQCTNNPEKAILLFETAILNNQASKKNYDLLDRNMSTMKFIVGAFSSLKKNTDFEKKLRLTLLRSFDTILKNFRYRRTSEKMLDELL